MAGISKRLQNSSIKSMAIGGADATAVEPSLGRKLLILLERPQVRIPTDANATKSKPACFHPTSSACQRQRLDRIPETRRLRISAANSGPNLFHQNRTVSWPISMPRSCSRSSTFGRDNGRRMYSSPPGGQFRGWSRSGEMGSVESTRDAKRRSRVDQEFHSESADHIPPEGLGRRGSWNGCP
jgi:hypothetical protein